MSGETAWLQAAHALSSAPEWPSVRDQIMRKMGRRLGDMLERLRSLMGGRGGLRVRAKSMPLATMTGLLEAVDMALRGDGDGEPRCVCVPLTESAAASRGCLSVRDPEASLTSAQDGVVAGIVVYNADTSLIWPLIELVTRICAPQRADDLRAEACSSVPETHWARQLAFADASRAVSFPHAVISCMIAITARLLEWGFDGVRLRWLSFCMHHCEGWPERLGLFRGQAPGPQAWEALCAESPVLRVWDGALNSTGGASMMREMRSVFEQCGAMVSFDTERADWCDVYAQSDLYGYGEDGLFSLARGVAQTVRSLMKLSRRPARYYDARAPQYQHAECELDDASGFATQSEGFSLGSLADGSSAADDAVAAV